MLNHITLVVVDSGFLATAQTCDDNFDEPRTLNVMNSATVLLSSAGRM